MSTHSIASDISHVAYMHTHTYICMHICIYIYIHSLSLSLSLSLCPTLRQAAAGIEHVAGRVAGSLVAAEGARAQLTCHGQSQNIGLSLQSKGVPMGP